MNNHTCQICGISSSFNYKGETKGVRCRSHVLPEMVNIKYKSCEYPDCYRRRSTIKDMDPNFCFDHGKQIETIEINHKKCIQCKKITR